MLLVQWRRSAICAAQVVNWMSRSRLQHLHDRTWKFVNKVNSCPDFSCTLTGTMSIRIKGHWKVISDFLYVSSLFSSVVQYSVIRGRKWWRPGCSGVCSNLSWLWVHVRTLPEVFRSERVISGVSAQQSIQTPELHEQGVIHIMPWLFCWYSTRFLSFVL